MKPDTRSILPAIITAVIGIIFSATTRHVLPREYCISGCVFFIMLSWTLMGMHGLRAFRRPHNHSTGHFFVLDSETPSQNWLYFVSVLLIFFLMCYVPNGRDSLYTQLPDFQMFVFFVIYVSLLPFCAESIIRCMNAAYDFDSLLLASDGKNCRNEGKDLDSFVDKRERDTIDMLLFSYLLSTLFPVWLLSSSDTLGLSTSKSLLCGIHAFSSMVIVSSLYNTSLHHRALLDTIKKGGLSAETVTVVDVHRAFARLEKRIALGFALLFYPTMFYFMYVLLS